MILGVRTHPPLLATFPPAPRESCNIGIAPQQPEDTQFRLTKTYIVASHNEECQNKVVSSETIAAQVVRLDLARTRPSPHGKSPFVTVAQLIAGTAKYMSVDMSRYTAYAPRSLFQPNQYQQKGPLPATAQGAPKGAHSPKAATADGSSETTLSAAATKERLPITAIKFDARTLNLHLSLRIQEVLGCAEAMWDFVEAYQEGACLSQSPSSRAPSMTSSNTGSDGASSKPSRPAYHTTRNPKWKKVLALRRSEFDAMLRRFKL